MDIEEIKTLTDLMVENDLSEIMIRDGEKRIVLRRGAGPNSHPTFHPMPSPPVMAVAPAPPRSPTPSSTNAFAPALVDPGLQPISSPMVGTFYAAANPESPPFVKIGDKVSPETVVCIIEAMKVFNEIKAERAGTIESIDIRNGAPVEFGQPLMMVRIS
jgi:acetyl-CoA carboxylase biotin carboxyl carrier protein